MPCGINLVGAFIFLVFPVTVFCAETYKNVLVLESHQRTMGESKLHTGLSASLRANSIAAELSVEYLDLVRFSGPEYEAKLISHLQSKYSNQKIDIVVCSAFPALQFFMKHGAGLLPGAQVVFSSVEQRRLVTLQLPPGVTGVTHTDDLAGVIEAALQMQPDTERVFVIGGVSDYDRYWISEHKKAFQQFAGRIQFEYLTELAIIDLLERLRRLPPHSIVYLSSLTQDGAGRTFGELDSSEILSKTSNRPAYSIVSTPDRLLGIVGGTTAGFDDRVERAVEVVRRILSGENARDIPIERAVSKPRFMFDARQLRRWNIPVDRAPKDSLIAFREPTFWEMYRWLIAGLTSLFVAEGALIFGLLVNRARRRRAERALAQRLEFERTVSRISSAFIDLPIAEIDATIRAALEQIRDAVGSNDIVLREYVRRDNSIRVACCWEPVRCSPALLKIDPLVNLPWLLHRFTEENATVLLQRNHPPDETRNVREYLQAAGFESCLAVSCPLGNEALLVLYLLSSFEQKNTDLLRQDLQVVTQVFANTLNRKRTEEALIQGEEALRKSNDQVRDLAARLMDAQEEERRRIAGELHDDLGQRLAVVGLSISGIKRQVGDSSHKASQSLSEVQERLLDFNEAIRALSHKLHPGMLERVGISEALAAHCNEFSRISEIPVTFETKGEFQKLNRYIALGLFRVTQEALTNIRKHATATQISIHLSHDEEQAELRIVDNGSGFELGRLNRSRGLGLTSMEERIRFLGGCVRIESAPGAGTTICVNVPTHQRAMSMPNATVH